jgi:hypothetical protein
VAEAAAVVTPTVVTPAVVTRATRAVVTGATRAVAVARTEPVAVTLDLEGPHAAAEAVADALAVVVVPTC